MGQEYAVSFELFINSYSTSQWQSILHFTHDKDSQSYGDRNPAVWMTGKGEFHIAQARSGNSLDYVQPKMKSYTYKVSKNAIFSLLSLKLVIAKQFKNYHVRLIKYQQHFLSFQLMK